MDFVGAIASLVRVVETGSFSAVARERDVSKAAVARQVSCLEQHFGVRLLHRTTRKQMTAVPCTWLRAPGNGIAFLPLVQVFDDLRMRGRRSSVLSPRSKTRRVT